MWPLLVVVANIDAKDLLELSAVEDEEPVEALAPDGADPALDVRVCVRCPHRYSNHARVMPNSSASWLRKKLRRRNLLSGRALRRMVLQLRSKLPAYVEVSYFEKLEYFIERINRNVNPVTDRIYEIY